MPMTEEQLKGILRRFDTNGDGKISRRELRVGLRNLGLRFAGFRARRSLRHADANGDGVISEEEMNELAKYVSKWGISII
ncbi:Calcium-binding EF-hand [Cynara cardunculus var. scolymus]|uniref:Calcium-binding EF-hand n=1 Tax=Cynara cardunculus var. scolymus TaxID=59895 RepID=A0A103YCN6_CYNCS|nr:Calcium-binding EF-hand [Cynara cardunculus var. scolymus]